MLVDVGYREADVGDVAAMVQCRRDDRAAGPADERMAAYLAGQHHPQQAERARVGFVATAHGAVIGYIAGHLTRRFGCQGELQYLYVAPPYRRKGIASALLQRLAVWFTDHEALHVCVNVDQESPGARAFYVRMGATDLRPYWMEWREIQHLRSVR